MPSPRDLDDMDFDISYGCKILMAITGENVIQRRIRKCLHCPLWEKYRLNFCLEERSGRLPQYLKEIVDEILST